MIGLSQLTAGENLIVLNDRDETVMRVVQEPLFCLFNAIKKSYGLLPPYTKIADAILHELRSWASACVIRNPPIFDGSLLTTINGPGGNRTRVQTGIPCTSTIIVHFFTFPPPDENEHPSGFSSFMIRPCTQSLMHVVSYIVDAWVLKCRCLKSDSCH